MFAKRRVNSMLILRDEDMLFDDDALLDDDAMFDEDAILPKTGPWSPSFPCRLFPPVSPSPRSGSRARVAASKEAGQGCNIGLTRGRARARRVVTEA